MNTPLKTPQPRWRVSEGIAAELAMLRREKHFKSWDEFFRAIIILLRSDSDKKLPIPDPTPMKTVLTKLTFMEEAMTHALAKISTHIEVQQGINQILQATMDETHEATNGVRTLLEFVLKSEETPPPETDDKISKAIRYLQNRF